MIDGCELRKRLEIFLRRDEIAYIDTGVNSGIPLGQLVLSKREPALFSHLTTTFLH